MGGIGNYCEGVAEALARRGYSVHVAVPADLSGCYRSIKEKGHPLVIPVYSPGGFRAGKLIHQVRAFAQILESSKPFLIICFDSDSWKVLNFLNIFRQYPFTLVLHGSDILSTRRSIRGRLFGQRFLFKGVARIIANSRQTLKLARDKFPVCRDIDSAIGYPAPARELQSSYAKQAGADHHTTKLTILTVSRIEPRKDHIETFHALQALPQTMKENFQWIVVGEPVDTDYYEAFKEEVLSARFSVNLTGKVSPEMLAGLYREADVFLLAGKEHPTKIEGFGIVYLEAGLFAVPSVANAIGGVSEAVLHGETGFLSNPGDTDSLARHIHKLLEDTQLRKKFGEAARRHAEKFTWEQTASILINHLSSHD